MQGVQAGFLLAWLGWLVPVVLSGGPALAEDIVLGMSAAFSGPSRGLGIELYRGSMAYFGYLNRSGGIHGNKVVIKAYDDGYNPTPAIQNTIKLIEEDNAFLLFNYVGTPTVTRVLPLLKNFNKRSVFLFFPFTGAEPQRRPPYNEFVFNLRASYGDETRGLVDHFLKIGRARIGIFYQADAYGRSGWEGVKKALAIYGLKIAAEATYRRGTQYSESLKQQVEILKSAQPDAIISIGAYAACAAFIRDARDSGWDVPIANVSFVGSENLAMLLLESGAARGKDYSKNLINSQKERSDRFKTRVALSWASTPTPDTNARPCSCGREREFCCIRTASPKRWTAAIVCSRKPVWNSTFKLSTVFLQRR